MDGARSFGEAVAAWAVAAAAATFAVKWAMGWFYTNLSLELRLARHPFDSDRDGLTVTLVLSKGDRHVLSLERIEVGVTELGEAATRPLDDVLKSIEASQVLDLEDRKLRMTRGERTEFGQWFLVPAGRPVLALAAVSGPASAHGRALRWGHWRATAVSAPLDRAGQRADGRWQV